MYEFCPVNVTAQDVCVGCVSKSDNSRIASTTQLACDKELTGVTATALVFIGHDDVLCLTLGMQATL
jgi:hypothetical protein